MAAMLLLPVTPAAITFPTFGAAVVSTTTDWKPSLIQQTASELMISRWDRGVNGDVIDDCFYINFGASSQTTFSAGDYRIGGGDTSTCTAGVILTSSSTEVASAVTAHDYDKSGALTDITTLVKYLEIDGLDGFSPGDMPYVDLNSGATGCGGSSGTIGVCDLRLATRSVSGTSLSFGTIVKSGEKDVAESADDDGDLPDTATFTDFTDSDVEVWYYDANENRQLDSGDTLYLRLKGNAPASQEAPDNYAALVPFVMDVRLTAFGSLAAGTSVAAGDADHLPTLEAAPTNKVVRLDGTSSTTDLDDIFVLVFQSGTPTRIQFGDIILTGTSSYTAGTVATTAATGLGLAVASSSAVSAGDLDDLVYYVDLNSNGRYDSTDGVYMNRPSALNGNSDTNKLSEEDIRLVSVSYSGGSYAAGSVVTSGQTDLRDFTGQGASTAFVLKLFDADRGHQYQGLRTLAKAKVTGGAGTLSVGEGVYYDGDSDGKVNASDKRLTKIDYAEGSTVAAGNVDIGEDAFENVTIKISGGDTTYSIGEDAYVDANATGSNADQVTNGDVRVTAVGSYAAASTVSCTDANANGVYDEVGDTDCGTDLSNPVTLITGSDYTWASGEHVYVAGANTTAVAAGQVRIIPVTYAEGSTPSCGSDLDCYVALTALTDAKVTGSDGTWSSGSEYAYVSSNHRVDAGDTRISRVAFNSFAKETDSGQSSLSTVAAGDADFPSDVGAADSLYLSPTGVGTAATDSKIPLQNDVRLLGYSGATTFGARVTTLNKDFSPRLIAAATLTLYRFNAGDSGSFLGDGFYVSQATASSSTPQVGDPRLLPVFTYRAGSIVESGQTDAPVTTSKDTGGAITARVGFINPSASQTSGYDSKDFVYVDTTFFSGDGSGSLSSNDIRVTGTSGLSTNYVSGSLVNSGDVDRTTYSTFGSLASGLSWKTKFVDQDQDGTFDAGDPAATGEHILIGTDQTTCADATLCSAILLRGDIFLSSSAAASTTATSGTTTATTTATTTQQNQQTTTQQTTTTAATTTGAETTTGSETINPDQNETEEAPTPGIGLAVAIAAIAGAVLVAARRREDD